MIKNIQLITVAIITACACASSNAEAPVCPPKGMSMLTLSDYHLVFNEKKPICVTVPGSFLIKIHNPPNSDFSVGKGDVTIEAKSSDGLTIIGTNDDEVDKITVTVDGNLEMGKEVYDFLIRVDGLGILDPKVRVVDNDTMMSLKFEGFSESLDALDISPELAAEFIATQQETKPKGE